MSQSLAIRGGHVIDPANGVDAVGDVLIVDGRVAAVGKDAGRESTPTIDARGLLVCPGFVDIHCHLREPGFEHKETIATGTLAAARGGFTTLCAMPNTQPPLDTAAAVEFVLRTATAQGMVRVLPIGCISKGRAGQGLAELADLVDAGAIAFSDDGDPISDPHLMRRALEYASMLDRPVINHCEDVGLSADGVMHEGWVAARLGLKGIPAAAEESMVARDIALARLTRSPIHIAHVSTAGTVDLIRQAKGKNLPVTAEVTPHHLTLTDEAVLLGAGEAAPGLTSAPGGYDTNAKVNPPLRAQADVEACGIGLADGTIDCIATDHAPHAIEDKLCEFDAAAFGISGLETALALCLSLVHGVVGAVREPPLQLATLIERLTIGPVRALGLDRHTEGPVPSAGSGQALSAVEGLGTLSPGAPGDVTLFDPTAEWTVEPERFASKGKNTPLAGPPPARASGGDSIRRKGGVLDMSDVILTAVLGPIITAAVGVIGSFYLQKRGWLEIRRSKVYDKRLEVYEELFQKIQSLDVDWIQVTSRPPEGMTPAQAEVEEIARVIEVAQEARAWCEANSLFLDRTALAQCRKLFDLYEDREKLATIVGRIEAGTRLMLARFIVFFTIDPKHQGVKAAKRLEETC